MRRLGSIAVLTTLIVGLLHIALAPNTAAVASEGPADVKLGTTTLYTISTPIAGRTPEQAARQGSRKILAWARDIRLSVKQITVEDDPPISFIGMEGPNGEFSPAIIVDDRAADAAALPRLRLAERQAESIREGIETYRSAFRPIEWAKALGLGLLALGLFLLLLRLQRRANQAIRSWISNGENSLLSGWKVGETEIIAPWQERGVLQVLRIGVHWIVLITLAYLFIPVVLGSFPPTRGLAMSIWLSLLQGLGHVWQGFVNQLPSLVTLVIIAGLTFLLIRASNAWFKAVHDGQINLPWFYPEWATPTARLVAIGLLFIGVSMAFPYVPGSGSKAFQGAGLFFGALAILGSSAVATNMISGMVLIYTRSFQEGDLIRIDQLTGTVQSSSLLVTRLRTASNELVSVPNSSLLSSHITNFSLSKREVNQPVALTPEVTIGYDVPWRKVHGLLIDAAMQTDGIGRDPEPFVLQTSLNDFHITYKLIAFLLDDHAYPLTLSALLGHIQDCFAQAEVEILSPGYQALRSGRSSTVPHH